MNIFYLHHDTDLCARYHVDRHVVKMIIEYAQLLSTAHRLLDGELYIDSSSGRKIKRWRLDDPFFELSLLKASHINHPSAIWVRDNLSNLTWLYSLWLSLLKEYTFRYNKQHALSRLIDKLSYAPIKIKSGSFTEPTPAMPDIYKVPNNSLESYHNYYKNGKKHLHSWKKREVPHFINMQE